MLQLAALLVAGAISVVSVGQHVVRDGRKTVKTATGSNEVVSDGKKVALGRKETAKMGSKKLQEIA